MFIPKRKYRVWFRRNKHKVIKNIAWVILIFGLFFWFLGQISGTSGDYIAPTPTPTPEPEYEFNCSGADFCTYEETEPTPTIEPTASPSAVRSAVKGVASYYSVQGCLGCRDDRLMANGEVLDDTRLTVAYNRALLNSHVEIVNIKNGKMTIAKVTDRGGFERHGKIIDLSLATKKALGCGDVCSVKIYEVNKEITNADNLHLNRP